MGVKGFPTLKTVRPTLKIGKPIVQDYQGPRTAKGIADAVRGLIPNQVTRVADKDLNGWLSEGNDTSKAILFSDKGTTSALIKVLAGEFHGRLPIAQIRDKDATAVSMFGITKYPTLLILTGGNAPAVVYKGEMKKAPMQTFLSKYAAAVSSESTTKDKKQKPLGDKIKKSSTEKVWSPADESQFSAASASHASEEVSSEAATASTVTIDLPNGATESPDPIATSEDTPGPAVLPDLPPPVPTLLTEEELQAQCLGPKTPTCVVALLPSVDSDDTLSVPAAQALASLAELAEKHKQRGTKLFPFFAVPASNIGASGIREGLGLKGDTDVELLAMNGRRGWWKGFLGKGYGIMDVESWVDGIRLGEGKKEKFPEGFIVEETPASDAEKVVEESHVAEDMPVARETPVAEDSSAPVAEETPAPEAEPEATPAIIHEDL
ncbi:hypothetical protein MMC14_006692 [Varicellaria rhodocarpa]|nr:hypothetical protein [Varicellaria rhodocarpa]